MNVNFNINEKTHTCEVRISPDEITNQKELKNLMALITIVSADFYLDPELELEQLQELIDQGAELKKKMLIEINEDGIELEYKE